MSSFGHPVESQRLRPCAEQERTIPLAPQSDEEKVQEPKKDDKPWPIGQSAQDQAAPAQTNGQRRAVPR